MEAYRTCHEPFLRYCSALCFGKMDTEDLVQDVLLSAFQKFDQIQNKNQLKHYLIRAARNTYINGWRRNKWKGEIAEKQLAALKNKDVSADKILDIELLYKILDLLPEKQKDALILFEISGFSMREIAEIQNSTEGAVKTKISRGREKMRSLIEKNTDEYSNFLGIIKAIA